MKKKLVNIQDSFSVLEKTKANKAMRIERTAKRVSASYEIQIQQPDLLQSDQSSSNLLWLPTSMLS